MPESLVWTAISMPRAPTTSRSVSVSIRLVTAPSACPPLAITPAAMAITTSTAWWCLENFPISSPTPSSRRVAAICRRALPEGTQLGQRLIFREFSCTWMGLGLTKATGSDNEAENTGPAAFKNVFAGYNSTEKVREYLRPLHPLPPS